MTPISLAKLHGAGNDFLVLADRRASAGASLTPDLVRAICDRHRGIGADGLIRASEPEAGGDIKMMLWNADGSRAETSGNGLRCFVLAALHSRLVSGPTVLVETDAGVRRVEVQDVDGQPVISVEMGKVVLGPGLSVDGLRGRRASVGNPHLVLVNRSLRPADIVAIGRRLDAAEPGGLNVELIGAGEHGDLDLEVWERGIGITLSCGTGSCAAAAVARSFGLCGDEVEVRNPGGVLAVRLSGDPLAPDAFLSGPTQRIATITVDPVDLLGGEHAGWTESVTV